MEYADKAPSEVTLILHSLLGVSAVSLPVFVAGAAVDLSRSAAHARSVPALLVLRLLLLATFVLTLLIQTAFLGGSLQG
jgi:hypothetical protein